MGTPKYNDRGLKLWPSRGQYEETVASGGAVIQTQGCDAQDDQIRVWGKWTDTGAGAIANVSGSGISGVVRNGAGIWTVTFNQGFQALQYADASVQHEASGASTDDVAQVGAFTAGVAGACTLVVLNFTGAAAADPAAGDYICFNAVLLSRTLD
jgi:hypothetical protein